jgi:hypothetical protein
MIKIKNYVDYYMNIIYQNLRINQFLAIIDWFPIRPAGCDDQTTDPPLVSKAAGASSPPFNSNR